MILTVRKSERAAVAAILEDESYDSADAMADAIVKTVAGELAKRDGFIVFGGAPGKSDIGPFGPFWDRRDAEKFGSALYVGADPSTRFAHRALHHPPELAQPGKPQKPRDKCTACGHYRSQHDKALGCCGRRPDVPQRGPIGRESKCSCGSMQSDA